MKKIFKTTIVSGIIATGLALTACNNSHNNSSDMETHQHSDETYACPMHPDVKGKKGDTCPKCNMNLELVQADKSEQFDVKITPTPEKIEAGKAVQLSLDITENGKKAPIDVVHEKKVHMLVVNQELTWFDHIHPEEQSNGNYTVSETFPYGGKYLIYTDFKPSSASGIVNQQELEVHGEKNTQSPMTANKFVSIVDGYKITLVNGDDFKTNRAQHMGFSIEKDGKYITSKDITPFLGAVAHVVMIGKEDKNFMHIHPTSNEKYPIHGETSFEKSGIYRMWVQFQIDGKVHTADFTVNVIKGTKTKEVEKHEHHDHQH